MKSPFFENTKMFLANTSIRGFSRIIRTESIFIKGLWSIFIITNTVFMSISICKVITDYLQYSVNIQTYTKFDNGTPFPAVTFCNHQPFSLNAYKLWETGEVMSPTEFNKKLRELAIKYLKEKENLPYKYNVNESLLWTTVLDRISIYYQSLDPKVAMQLGHNQSMFHNCMWWYNKNMAFDDKCQDNMLIVKPFSNPSYFTCYTVEPIPEVAMDISRVGIIIWLGPNENINIKHKQGFLFDIFEQAYGLRVALHAPGSYPNIDQIGRQIEPGRLNELNFQPVLNVRVDSPTKRCVLDPPMTYQDLDITFKYDNELCLNFEMQKRVVEKCRCLYGYYPRYFFPNSSINYCGNINFTDHQLTIERMTCVSRLMEDSVDWKKSLEQHKCLINCKNIEYSMAVSVTKWRPSEWQLFWLKQVTQHFTDYEDSYALYSNPATKNSTKRNLERDMKSHIQQLQNYMTRVNLSTNLHQKSKTAQSNIFGDRYTFVIVKRQDNNTIIKEERFVLTLSALISRIGGLSSLYVGLTFAFFAELIESFYMCLFSSHHEEPPRKMNHKNVEYVSSHLYPKANVNVVGNVDNSEDQDVRIKMVQRGKLTSELSNDNNPWVYAYDEARDYQE